MLVDSALHSLIVLRETGQIAPSNSLVYIAFLHIHLKQFPYVLVKEVIHTLHNDDATHWQGNTLWVSSGYVTELLTTKRHRS